MREVVIFIGLPGAGKSTLYRERFAATHALISKDLMGRQRHKQQRQLRLLRDELAHGQSVVVDNTNPTVADREPLIALSHEFDACVSGYYFDIPLAVCLERNRLRDDAACVPVVAIYAARKRLEPPSYGEGFAEIHIVSLGPMGDSVIKRLPIEPATSM